ATACAWRSSGSRSSLPGGTICTGPAISSTAWSSPLSGTRRCSSARTFSAGPPPPPPGPEGPAPSPRPPPGGRPRRAPRLGAVLLAVGASVQSTVGATSAVAVGDPSDVPMAFGDWIAVGADIEQSALRASNADHELARTYRSPTLGHAHLYVGYYASQDQG